eukprot:scaffold2478_cov220-Alexandrium_tamarense.AAC.4
MVSGNGSVATKRGEGKSHRRSSAERIVANFQNRAKLSSRLRNLLRRFSNTALGAGNATCAEEHSLAAKLVLLDFRSDLSSGILLFA